MVECEALLRQALRRRDGASAEEAYWLSLAYLVVLPVTLGMALFVDETARAIGARRVVFLARDGLIFKKVFEQLIPPRPDRAAAAYAWASRRCFNMAAIQELDPAAMAFLTSGDTPMSPLDYLRRVDIDLDRPDVAAAVASASVQGATLDKRWLEPFLRSIEPAIVARSERERDALAKHLQALGVYEGKSLVVDVGWHGSMQHSLIKLGESLGHAPDIEGAYLGTKADHNYSDRYGDMPVHGWLCQDAPPDDLLKNPLLECIEVIELLFSAPESGVLFIAERDGALEPIRLDEPAERHRLDIARLIHDEVEMAAGLLRPLAASLRAETVRELAMGQLTKLLSQPDAEDALWFSRVLHAEGFGSGAYRPIVQPRPAAAAPAALLGALEASFWRRAFWGLLSPPQRAVLEMALNGEEARRDLRSRIKLRALRAHAFVLARVRRGAHDFAARCAPILWALSTAAEQLSPAVPV